MQARMRRRSISVRYFFCSSRASVWLLLGVGAALGVGHLDVDGRVGAGRQLRQHLRPRPPQQDRRQLLADLVEIAIAQQFAVLVEHAMIVQELEGGAEPAVIDELHDAVQLFELVLQRRAGQHDGIAAAQPLDGPRRLRLPVLDALGLVEHDQVRLPGVQLVEVADGDFVVDEAIKRRLAILGAALRRRAVDDLHGRGR